MTRLFVTGTDTGVGKTTVSVALLAAARRAGLRPSALKPAESGCHETSPLDALALANAAGIPDRLTEVCPYRFGPAIAPGAAADREQRTIDFDLIRSHLGTLHRDFTLVEGAGGLLCPFGGGRTAADLAAYLDLPLLIVGRAGLGTINHTLLTLEVAAQRGLDVHAVILNDCDNHDDLSFARENAQQIAEHHAISRIDIWPHGAPDGELVSYADQFLRTVCPIPLLPKAETAEEFI